MTNYIGEFDCKIDTKGRMMLPGGLLKQFSGELKAQFVINKSVFQKCLILNPMDAWNELMQNLAQLNARFNKEHNDFIRQYTNGNTMVEIDATNRILIPKRLLDYAGIEKDVVLTASLNTIEIWSAQHYNEIMNTYKPEDFAALAQNVMGNKTTANNGN